MKRIFVLVMALAMIAMLSSCSKQSGTGTTTNASTAETSKGETVQVAFVTNNVSDFWKIAQAGVEQAEKDFNCKCDFRMPVQNFTTEQKQILEDLVTKGVSGVAISPASPDTQTDVINQTAGNINLICMDSDAPKSKRMAYVGTSNIDAGKVAGEQIKKVLPNGGKIMVYVGTLDAQNAADRYKGIQEALKGSKVQILGVMTDDADHTKARANVEDTLVKNPDVSCLVGLWSYNGPAIVNAVKAANKAGKIKIVCFDEDQETLQGVKDGAIFATVVQKPYEFGYQSVKLLAALARKEKVAIPANKTIDTGVEVINKSNVDAFSAKIKKMIGKA